MIRYAGKTGIADIEDKNVRDSALVRIGEGKGGRLSVGTAARSKDEIAGAIRSFTPAQWARLRKVAQSYSYALDAEDLLQEAFSRALDVFNLDKAVLFDPQTTRRI